MNKILHNIRLSFRELRDHVSWPSWDSLRESSILVLVASLIIAIIVFAMDKVFETLFGFIYDLF
ncbi:MAG: preprotein translocase subunit SecE [Bacteroidetes bacterium]|nr:preprotein translocase subunit SecE [Bacteroidota bacterium]